MGWEKAEEKYTILIKQPISDTSILNALKNLNVKLVDPSTLVYLEVKGQNVTICFSDKKSQDLLLKESLKLPQIEGVLRFLGEKKITFQIKIIM